VVVDYVGDLLRHRGKAWGKNVFIKLAFAYEATTQCSRTDRKPRSAHVTVLSALGSALAATALVVSWVMTRV
jgi:hypothetical protein